MGPSVTELLLAGLLAVGGSTDIVIPETGPAVITRSVKGACAAPSRGTSARTVGPAEVVAEVKRLQGCRVVLALYAPDSPDVGGLLSGLGARVRAQDDARLVAVGLSDKRTAVEAKVAAVGGLPAAPLHVPTGQDAALQEALQATMAMYEGKLPLVVVYGPTGEIMGSAMGDTSLVLSRVHDALSQPLGPRTPEEGGRKGNAPLIEGVE